MKRIVPGVDYYQVVFTMPDQLSSLALGNRREIFKLLFHSAWKSLKKVLEKEQQYEAAASMVLHTWNQHLESHVHVHAIVPGGGPSLTHPGTWKSAEPPPYRRPDRWWLVDADDLRYEFRNTFLTGLRQLHGKRELKLEGEWSHLQGGAAFEEFLEPLEGKTWVTYIQPPPTESSQPQDIVKYLSRYLTGGPISDHRIVKCDDQNVTFMARTGCQERAGDDPPSDVVPPSPAGVSRHDGSDEMEEVELPVVEFVRRWCLHILPKGFTKTRCFGGFSNYHHKRYSAQCRQLLNGGDAESDGTESDDKSDLVSADDESESRGLSCPTCGEELELIEREFRTSWRDVFSFDSEDRPSWYESWETSG